MAPPQPNTMVVIGFLATIGLLLIRDQSASTKSYPTQNALYQPHPVQDNPVEAAPSEISTLSITSQESPRHSQPDVDSCVPEYLRKALAPELLSNRLRIQDMQFYQTILASARALKVTPVNGHGMLEKLIPVVTGGCPTMKRMPESTDPLYDGGKWLCGMDNLAHDANCSIYSLGSNNQFEFEEAMVKHTGCHLHTFDCTVKELRIPSSIKDRMTFHPICLGADDVPDNRFKSLSTITKDLGTKKITLLKMDIESSEWPVMRAMFEDDWSALPDQFSVELHYNFKSIASTDYVQDPYDLALFSVIVHLAGYRAISGEKNPCGDCCSEFTFVRTRCPEKEIDSRNRL